MLIRFIAVLMALLMVSPPSYAALYANTVVFGGRGEDGDLTKSGTESTPIVLNARKLTVSGTWNLKSGSVINSSHDVSITGSVNVDQVLANPAHLYNPTLYPSHGLGAGINGIDSQTGGSGGGFGGKGGNSGRVGMINPNYKHDGGPKYTPDMQGSGSSGGYGGSGGGMTGGDGGNGGGSVRFLCGGNLTISGSGVVHIDGGNGADAPVASQSSGGGGGSGGFGLFAAMKSITVSATNGVTCKGGDGGDAAVFGSEGAGGGGGYLIFIAPQIVLTGGVNTTAGGVGSSTGGQVAATGGESGVTLQIQAVPTLPLIAAVDSKEEIDAYLAFCGTREKNEESVIDFIAYQNQRVKYSASKRVSETDKVRELGGHCEAA